MRVFIKEPAIQLPYPLSQRLCKESGTAVADAGYGSGQNCECTEDNRTEACVRYNYSHKEQKRAWKKNPFAVQRLFYNEEKDFLICPTGQKLTYPGTEKSRSEPGCISTLTRYQAQNCEGCP